MFVVGDPRRRSREVVIGPREELLGRGVVARELNWLVDAPVGRRRRVEVQVRHRAPPAARGDRALERDEIELALDEPVRAITPGQSLVLYDGDACSAAE